MRLINLMAAFACAQGVLGAPNGLGHEERDVAGVVDQDVSPRGEDLQLEGTLKQRNDDDDDDEDGDLETRTRHSRRGSMSQTNSKGIVLGKKQMQRLLRQHERHGSSGYRMPKQQGGGSSYCKATCKYLFGADHDDYQACVNDWCPDAPYSTALVSILNLAGRNIL